MCEAAGTAALAAADAAPDAVKASAISNLEEPNLFVHMVVPLMKKPVGPDWRPLNGNEGMEAAQALSCGRLPIETAVT
jgi:hypothetical protein